MFIVIQEKELASIDKLDLQLMQGERVIYQGRKHWLYWGWYGIWLSVCGLVLSLLYLYSPELAAATFLIVLVLVIVFASEELIILAANFFNSFFYYIVVTDMRVIKKEGLVRQKIEDMRFSKIKEVKTDDGMSGRRLGYTKFTIISTGDDKIEINFFPRKLLEHIHSSVDVSS